MSFVTLSMLQNALGGDVVAWDAELIKISASPSRLYRVAPRTAGGALPTVIVKVIEPDWPGDAHGADREMRFYVELLPQLHVLGPTLVYAGLDAETRRRILVLEDLARFRFPPPQHVWTPAEAECMVRAYAQLHHAGADVLEEVGAPEWLYPPYALRLDEVDIPALGDWLARIGVWPRRLAIERLYEETRQFAARHREGKLTILHNDVYPPNAGFGGETSTGCALIDWEMVGSGWAELDLAYMFTQPYGSSAKLDREAVHSVYWQERERLGSHAPGRVERETRQYYADALLALWLIPVAHRVASGPFPEGSPPARYWSSMFCVLYRRLDALCSANK